ncbi:MAG: phosphatase PAP2 family protein [Dissulfurispiraceae bacterium]|jgi:membrane-associated phospholipid phosphatase|nr:phosphatase PAP2 family protein [Dissulfurispiraceae bacterium]
MKIKDSNSLFRPADQLNILFCAGLAMLVLLNATKIDEWPYLLLIYSSLIFFQIIICRLKNMNSLLRYTRDIIFPLVSILICFDSLGLIVNKINPQDIDHILIQLDYQLFGLHPTLYLQRYLTPVLSDMLQAAYATYYFLPVALGVVLKIRKKNEDFNKSLFFVMLCFYLSYVGYIIWPALGPRYAMPHLYENDITGLLVSGPIQNILNLLEGVKRDAFPSGHTGIALTVLYLAYRYSHRLFWIILTPVILLIIATVMCRYHYVVDVIGGLLLAVATVAAGELYYTLIKNHENTIQCNKRQQTGIG